MKLHRVGEFQICKARRAEITDLYQGRLAIYEMAKAMKERCDRWPTHIFFPSDQQDRFGFLIELVQRHGAIKVDMYKVPFNEIWVGFQDDSNPMTGSKMPDWVRRPSQTYEEIRHIQGPRRRSRIVRRGVMSEVIQGG